MKGFASDNNAGVHPAVMQYIEKANKEHQIAYGDDTFTIEALKKFKQVFGNKSETFFVYNGTAANTLGISAATNSYHAVVCADTAHINVDECGAPEKFSGCKLLPVSSPDGKIQIDDISPLLHGIGFEHHVQPKIISITQATELGTVYSIDEIKTISDFAHSHNMFLHMDGARIANAAVSLNCDFRQFTADAGVDVLSFGGTKNGMMYGEAIVFFNPELAQNFKYLRKQGMQLASKMRYIAAQFLAYFENDLWWKLASNSNQMAALLYKKVNEIDDVKITQKPEANGVFAIIPPEVVAELQKNYFFYVWNAQTSEVRWMTSFDTTEDEIVGFTNMLKSLMHNR
jgi:threonine aldolase